VINAVLWKLGPGRRGVPARTLRAVEDRPRAAADMDRRRHPGPVLAGVIVKEDPVGSVEWTFSIG